ncbi:MAG: hypothetical protein LBK73_13185 [Treponema sp.]|jgi:hypothetical protein|nr:hypothetical protein [Treponema sp.]
MSESTFSVTYNERGLPVKQMRIKTDRSSEAKEMHSVTSVWDDKESNGSREFSLVFPDCNMKRAINIPSAGNLLKTFV